MDKILKIRTYQYFTDPGHGWVKVPFKEIVKLGLEKDISNCSYIFKEYIYLEHDRDFGLFQKEMNDCGVKVQLTNHNAKSRHSRIRNYEHYVCAHGG